MASPLTVYASGTDANFVRCIDDHYADARAGTGTNYVAYSPNPTLYAGQYYSTTYACREGFLAFDTSGVPDDATVSSVVLSLYGHSDGSDTDDTVQVYLKDWSSGGCTTADFVAGDDLSSQTLLATFDTTGFSAEAYNVFSSEAAFASSVNKTGKTYVMLASSRMAAGNTPTGNEWLRFYADTTDKYPKLVVSYVYVRSEAGLGSGSFSASGALAVQKAEATTGAIGVGATGTIACISSETASATFSVGASGLLAAILLEGTASASVAASGAARLTASETGTGAFSIAANGDVTLVEATWSEAGAASVVLTASGSAGVAQPESGTAEASFAIEGDVFLPVARFGADGGVALGGEPWLTAVAHGADTFTAIGYIRTASIARLTVGEALPATDDLGWTVPDAADSDLLGLQITLGGITISRSKLSDMTIELSNEGGPVSATLSYLCDPSRVPKLGSSIVITYKGHNLFRGRLENISSEVSSSTGYTLTYASPLVVLRDHKSFRRVYVDSDLESWRVDQAPQTSSNVWEVRLPNG